MNKTTINSILIEALSAPLGLVVDMQNYSSANSTRRKLYAFREKEQRTENHQYDNLSFVAKKNGELLIIKRSEIEDKACISPYSTRQLQEEECPKKLIARGKKKLGLIGQMIMNSLQKNNIQ